MAADNDIDTSAVNASLPLPTIQGTDNSSLTVQADSHSITNAAIVLLNAIGRLPPAIKSKTFPMAFVVDDEIIRNLQYRINEVFAEETPFYGAADEFTAKVGMPDLSAQTFDDLERFLRRAGDKRDPERLELSWRRRLMSPPAGVVSIEISFITEKKLNTEELGLFDYNISSAELQVSGQTDEWVDKIFADLEPVMLSTKLSGLYRPLMIFRNKLAVHIMSQTCALACMMISIGQISRIMEKKVSISREQIVEQIGKFTDVPAKLDALAKAILTPEASPWFEPLVTMAGAALVFVIALTASLVVLPMFVPKSCIAVGLAKRRYLEYENMFKFLIFTLGVSGLLVPIARALLNL